MDYMYQPQETEKMYRREKQNLRKNPRNPSISQTIPSFSSSLLDEIYKSIDQNEKSPNPKCLRNRVLEKQSNANVSVSVVRDDEKPKRRVSEDEIEAISRAYLIENWIKKNNLATKSKQFEGFDNNSLFFGSSSSSSGSNSSFETLKKIKTNTKPKKTKTSSDYKEGDAYFLENYHNFQNEKNIEVGLKSADNLIKSKSRALNIYNNLKKIKQPISPGGRLTSFLNSLFKNGVSKNPKKTKNPSPSISTCSSASSYTRSCLTKNSSKSNIKSSNGEKRSVSFCATSVIIDEDIRACGQKYVFEGDFKENEILGKRENVKGYGEFEDKNEDEDDDDMASDTSSDMFDFDHLAFVGNNNRYSAELPIYETTHFRSNIGLVY